MSKSFSKEQKQQFHSYLKIQLKEEQLSLPVGKQLILLQKKKKKQWWLLIFNIVVILFFGYSFYSGITQLGVTLLYVLIAVFIINMGLILYQIKRINELIDYLSVEKDS